MPHRRLAVKQVAFRSSLLVLALLAVYAPANTASAQTDLGVYFGPNFSWMSGSYVEGGATFRRGFAGGFFVERRLHRHWSLELAFNFTQKGSFEVRLPGADSLVDYRFSYLQLPVTGHYLLPLSDDWTIGFFGGGAPAVGTSCEIKPSTVFEFEDECKETTPGGVLKDIDVVVLIGAEVRRTFKGGSRFGFDIRYSLGMLNALQGASDAGLSARNNALDIFIRFGLPVEGPR